MINLFAILDNGEMLHVTSYGYLDGLVSLMQINGYYAACPEQLAKDLTKDRQMPSSVEWVIEGLTGDGDTLQQPFRFVRKFFVEVWE